jgi:hypothetical protein
VIVQSDYVMMASLMTGRCQMEIMWSPEKMTRRVQNTPFQMLIDALIIVFLEKNRTNWARYKVCTHSMQMAQYSDRIT